MSWRSEFDSDMVETNQAEQSFPWPCSEKLHPGLSEQRLLQERVHQDRQAVKPGAEQDLTQNQSPMCAMLAVAQMFFSLPPASLSYLGSLLQEVGDFPLATLHSSHARRV